MAGNTNDVAVRPAETEEKIDSSAKPEPIQLVRYSAGRTPLNYFKNTYEYTCDPKAYLEKTIGESELEKKKELLCIPKTVDQDIYGTGELKTQFQNHFAKLFGKESALFFITGVQAQLAALKIHCERSGNNRVAWHSTSHLETAEERSFERLYGLQRRLLGSSDDENPTVDEIKEVLSLPEHERPTVILLELPSRTIGCKTYEFKDLQTISAACKEANVKFHCDGARIWEIEPYYQKTAGKTFKDLAELFDTFYVSFYKGLRGVAGAVLLGEESLITEASVWQRRAGGTVVTMMYEITDCNRGYNENINTFKWKWDKMSEVQESVLSATEKFKTKDGKPIVDFMAKPATCCQVRTTFSGFTKEALEAARDKVQEKSNVRVFEGVRPKQTVDEKMEADRRKENGAKVEEPAAGTEHEIEWMIGKETGALETKVFVDAYVALCEELLAN